MMLLQRGQVVRFQKEELQDRCLRIGLGWDPTMKRQSIWQTLLGGINSFDCDASVMMLQDNQFLHKKDLIYFGNRISLCGSVIHGGDNQNGNGSGDDEVIFIYMNKIPDRIQRLLFVVNIYDCVSREQDFGMIQNAYIRIEDTKTNEELVCFRLTEDYSGATTLVVAELSRDDDGWKFVAIGEGTKDRSLGEFALKYQ